MCSKTHPRRAPASSSSVTPPGSPPNTYSTFILVRLRQDPLHLIPTKQQKRNTFSVLLVHRMTNNENSQSGFNSGSQPRIAMQSAICPAQLSAQEGPDHRQRTTENEPPTTLIMAPIDAPHDSMGSLDQIRSLPTPSILLRQTVNTMHRPWNLNSHLWTTAENLIRRKVAGGKIKCKIRKQKEAYMRERLECCVRVCKSTPGSRFSCDDGQIQMLFFCDTGFQSLLFCARDI
jgi:hypothetical protein